MEIINSVIFRFFKIKKRANLYIRKAQLVENKRIRVEKIQDSKSKMMTLVLDGKTIKESIDAFALFQDEFFEEMKKNHMVKFREVKEIEQLFKNNNKSY